MVRMTFGAEGVIGAVVALAVFLGLLQVLPC